MLARVCGVESLRETRGLVQNTIRFLFWALYLLVVPQSIALLFTRDALEEHCSTILDTEFTYEY